MVKTKDSPLGGYPYGDSYENGRSEDQEEIVIGAGMYDAYGGY